MKEINKTDIKDVSDQARVLNTTQTFYIVGANDFNPIELAQLDAITFHPLANARWAMDGSAFIVMFVTGDNPSPMMDNYPVYTNISIQPIVTQWPWTIAF